MADAQRCVAVCRECSFDDKDGAMVVPFSSKATRDDWLRSHQRGNEHEVVGLNGWPGAGNAYHEAFGGDL